MLIEGWTKKVEQNNAPRTTSFCIIRASGSLRSADCAVCSDGYAPQLGFTCTKCLDAANGAVLASLVLVAIAFAAVAVASYVMSGERPGKRRGVVERVARFVPLQSIKIVVVSWQILTQVRATHFSCVHVYIYVCTSYAVAGATKMRHVLAALLAFELPLRKRAERTGSSAVVARKLRTAAAAVGTQTYLARHPGHTSRDRRSLPSAVVVVPGRLNAHLCEYTHTAARCRRACSCRAVHFCG